MPVSRSGKKWVARVVHKGGRYQVGVFGSEEAARAALAKAYAEVEDGTSPLLGPPGTLTIEAFATSIGVRYGTVKRWAQEGMPVHRSGAIVRVSPELARPWVDEHHKDTIAFMRSSVVYVMRRESDGAYKIGWTSDVSRRLAELRKKLRDELVLLVAYQGDKPDEGKLHARFIEDRIEGEWYRPSPKLVAFVQSFKRVAA